MPVRPLDFRAVGLVGADPIMALTSYGIRVPLYLTFSNRGVLRDNILHAIVAPSRLYVEP